MHFKILFRMLYQSDRRGIAENLASSGAAKSGAFHLRVYLGQRVLWRHSPPAQLTSSGAIISRDRARPRTGIRIAKFLGEILKRRKKPGKF